MRPRLLNLNSPLPGQQYNRASRLRHGQQWPLTLVTPDFMGHPLYVGAYPGLQHAGLDTWPHGVLRTFGISRLVNCTADQPNVGNRTLLWEVIRWSKSSKLIKSVCNVVQYIAASLA